MEKALQMKAAGKIDIQDEFDTREQSLREQLLNYYSTIAQMAAAIADEIRNPLAGIASTLSLMREESVVTPDNEKYEIIKACISRIDSFIEDLYLLSRPINPGFVEVEITDFIGQVIKQYFKEKSRPYTFTTVEDKMYAWADMVLLQSALSGILDNAVDATQYGGEIQITVGRREWLEGDSQQSAIITIADTGAGMNKDAFDNLFRPFFTSKHDGRGLGLAIARNYIRFHNGDIKIECFENAGTKVHIELPIMLRGKKWNPEEMYS